MRLVSWRFKLLVAVLSTLERRFAFLHEGHRAFLVIRRLAAAEMREGFAVEDGAEILPGGKVDVFFHVPVADARAVRDSRRHPGPGLLAQVGALYHDVGKIHKAHYFAENQEGGISRHENLAPTMSLLIILGHVKDGIEMAKEYKLPRALYPFIADHHGTTVLRYLHHMASEKQPRIASGKHDREVPESEFRYAGPKPRSKATAVLMLCDGVEGAVRALPEATVGRIEGVVHQIVMDRLNDGQFNECDITLREIHLVEESLVKSLCSIYHGRVAYPKGRKTEEQQGVQGKVSV